MFFGILDARKYVTSTVLSTFTVAGLIGALLLLLAHSFGKAGAFYSSGNIYEMSGTKSIDGVSGLIRNRASVPNE